MYKAVITITFKKSILDPQGSAVHKALNSLGYQNVQDVRVGKHIEVLLEGDGLEEARAQLEEMCAKLLANPVIEEYHVDVAEVRR